MHVAVMHSDVSVDDGRTPLPTFISVIGASRLHVGLATEWTGELASPAVPPTGVDDSAKSELLTRSDFGGKASDKAGKSAGLYIFGVNFKR